MTKHKSNGPEPFVKNANEAIARAAQLIAASDRNLKLAAELLASAEAAGKTQREMAKGVGKSAAWVNALLQWHRNGFVEDTPFGTQSQERDERHDERIREREREERSGPQHEQEREERLGPKHNNARSSRTRSGCRRSHSCQGFSEHDRTTLVRVLGCSAPATTTKCSSLPAKPRRFAAALGSPGTS